MLVLSRRAGERIVFPNLGMTLEVVRIQGNVTRLGIQAPSSIKILREEVNQQSADPPGFDPNVLEPASSNIAHTLRNRLQSALLAVQLLRRQQELGLAQEATATFEKVLRQFEDMDLAIATTRKLPEQPPAGLRPRALIVEDDTNQCELLASYLRISDFEVATASDGVSALEYLASSKRPDVVLLDMLMPRCDGPQTVKEIRCNPQFHGLKIVAVSGTSPDALGLATGPTGVDRWFPKPLNPEKLVREVKRDLLAASA